MRTRAKGSSRARLDLLRLEDRTTPSTSIPLNTSSWTALGSAPINSGTAPGTLLVKDITPGFPDTNPFRLTNVNGTLFFTAEDDTHGIELWRSNGTPCGTWMVAASGSTSAAAIAGWDPVGCW